MKKDIQYRFDRNMRFFGKDGQDKIAKAHVAVVGIGGLGTHVVQQLSLLGVGHLTLVDNEEIDTTNLNRYIGVRHSDPIPGTPKVIIGKRTAKEINPDIKVNKIPLSLVTQQAFDAIVQADYIFGCLDREGFRLILNELCSAYSKPYFDLASDIIPGDPIIFGGRICVAWNGSGCISCFGELDIEEAQTDLLDTGTRQNRNAIYGIQKDVLDQVGPSVVSINGVIASLAVTEFVVGVTEIREPKKLCFYHGHMGRVTFNNEEPAPDCYYCKGIRGWKEKAEVQRYLLSREGFKM